jgi:hypothetical protein
VQRVAFGEVVCCVFDVGRQRVAFGEVVWYVVCLMWGGGQRRRNR